ncbi:unnamed protein product [Brugia pahangi]|uniref:Kringle domain-containing protein n=1 Tax=Brugia pahangi TaxID=6280 RepID=A0A0N4TS17_BRUPA|nr:unnamed protein product [Brugia pahangi]
MLPCPTITSIDSVTVVVRARNNEQTAEMAPYYCFDEQCLYPTYTHAIYMQTHTHMCMDVDALQRLTDSSVTTKVMSGLVSAWYCVCIRYTDGHVRTRSYMCLYGSARDKAWPFCYLKNVKSLLIHKALLLPSFCRHLFVQPRVILPSHSLSLFKLLTPPLTISLPLLLSSSSLLSSLLLVYVLAN